jgi:hypothetical protein
MLTHNIPGPAAVERRAPETLGAISYCQFGGVVFEIFIR